MARPPIETKLSKYFNKLGKIPDHEIAQLADVSRTAVVNFRKRQGIPPYEGHKFLPAPAAVETVKPARVAVRTAPAEQVPVATPVVIEAQAPAAAPPAGSVAFSVAVDVGNESRTYVVAANDIVEAARLAVALLSLRHRDAKVKGVQRVGELL